MAIETLQWVFQLSHLKPSEKLVMISLADNRSADGNCYPGVETTADFACLSIRQTQRILRRLDSYNLITCIPTYSARGDPTSNRYQLMTTINPLTWRPPADDLQAKAWHKFCADFRAILLRETRLHFNGDHEQMHTPEMLLYPPLRIENVANRRITFAVPPDPCFGALRRTPYCDLLLRSAQLLKPTIRRFRIVCPPADTFR